ncbi:hypothetical protein Tco_0633315 [Tanacetum coccineum]
MSQPANDDFSQHLSDGEESNHEDASDTGTVPKQQQQVIPQTTAISNIKLPILKKEEYDIWAMGDGKHYLGEVLAGLAMKVIYSLFAIQNSSIWTLLHEDLEQIDDVDIEEMDINWQIAMIAIRMKKFYKKTGRRVRVDGKTPVKLTKRSLRGFNCRLNNGHFAGKMYNKGGYLMEEEE